MISTNEIDRIEGATAYDSSGEKVGKVDQLYLDDQTGQPSWATVTTGLFGTSQSFVPLQGASIDGNDVRLAYAKDQIKDAPRIDADQHLDRPQEDELYGYYGLESAAAPGVATDDGRSGDGSGHREVVDHDRTDEASMTLSEERLDVGTESHEAGRARLRRYTTTETESVTVPVTKEKLRVERQPASGESAAGAIDEGDHVEEVTLREERAVVDKETVPVEEVRVAKEQVTEQERVSADVRKERVDIDSDGDVSGTDTSRDGLGR